MIQEIYKCHHYNTLTISLFLRLAIVQLVILVVLGLVVYDLFHYRYKSSYDRSEQIRVSAVSQNLAKAIESLENYSYPEVQQLLLLWRTANPKIEVYILDDQGNILADSGGHGNLQLTKVPIDPIKKYLSLSIINLAPIYNLDPRKADNQVIFSAADLKIGAKSGFVYTVLNDEEFRLLLINSRVGTLLSQAAQDSILCASVAALIGGIVFYFITRRLKRAVNVIRNLEQGDYSQRLNLNGPADEIRLLMKTINHMAEAIENNVTELKRKDYLRRELIASVAHDLRSPAGIISGLNEVIQRDPGISPANLENCNILQESCKSLNRLLSELFELAKLEAKEITPDIAPFEIVELIDEISLAYKTAADKKGLQIITVYTLPLPQVRGDCSMISRVLGNLIENAIRYTPAGGTIKLSLELDDSMAISVSDTGIGIPSNELQFVFEKFYQVEHSSGISNGLSGLGLAIVKKIIEAHGGEIFVSSEEGIGTTFKFKLPVA